MIVLALVAVFAIGALFGMVLGAYSAARYETERERFRTAMVQRYYRAGTGAAHWRVD